MSARIEAVRLPRYLRFMYRPDEGFGSTLEVRIGWLNLNYSRYQNHLYLHLIWAKPLA